MIFSKLLLIVFGGNSGQQALVMLIPPNKKGSLYNQKALKRIEGLGDPIWLLLNFRRGGKGDPSDLFNS